MLALEAGVTQAIQASAGHRAALHNPVHRFLSAQEAAVPLLSGAAHGYYPGGMGYHRILVSEARVPLGNDLLFVNALHGVASIHEGEGVAAYEDRDRHVRISSYALLHWPRRVFGELMQLNQGRWSKDEVALAVRDAYRYVCSRLAR
ncbi:MAG TPA: hypothetical protein VNO30_49825 [Kofleriaceae bacterium]|nr:hypothetical protein [Kofleriaceae bacterium]